MAAIRRILIFIVITSCLILAGRLAPRFLPGFSLAARGGGPAQGGEEIIRDSTNALPDVVGDTTGGRWRERLFAPLLKSYGLGAKNLKRKKGYWELVFPQGKPIHEYALHIESLCAQNRIVIVKGVELHPVDRSVEYHLESEGQRIKLRASMGRAFMAGSAKLAIVFTGLDSLREVALAALEAAPWEKTLVINPHSPNLGFKKLRFTRSRNEILLELPMEPAAYPYVDPGKHALFIHHSKEEVDRLLSAALDSLPEARGFATRYGDRAIENQPLLERLFQFTAGRDLVFLDLTASQRSLARQVAAAQKSGGRCRTATLFKDSLQVAEELARKTALAQKTGEALLVMPYTTTGYRRLAKSLAENEVRFNQIGLELVTLSSLSGEVPDSAAAK